MIELSNISFSYKRNKVLGGISLSAKQGECIGIVGTNGCGKSTLLAIMAGILKPDSGTLFYDNKDALKKHSVFSKYTGYVPQDNPLIPELTVKDNLKLWFDTDPVRELQEGFLFTLGLTDYLKVPVYKLSGGIKKRVSLAIAYAGKPPVLILDEPSTALDLPCKEDIRCFLKGYLDLGGTILITTHEEAELALCTRLFVLKNGTLHAIPTHLRGKSLIQLL